MIMIMIMIMMIMMMRNNAILQKHRQGRHIPKISSIGVKIAEIREGSTWKTSKFPRPFILEAFKQFLLQLSIRCFLKLCSEVFAALERTARQEQTATRDVPAAASSLINSPHLLTPEESTRKNINQHSYLLIPFLYISRIILYTLPQISY